jgi:hypothetical protein
MSNQPQQSLATHVRYDPPYHFFAFMVVILNFPVTIWFAWQNPSFQTIWGALFALALVVACFRIRTYPLRVQDRVIRLEERLRLMRLLPESEHARIGQLTEAQLIALRFASDEELPQLARKAIEQNLDKAEIKKQIRNWRPDYWRI